MRKLVAMALVLVGCGGGTALSPAEQGLSGEWVSQDDSGILWEVLTLDQGGFYRQVYLVGAREASGTWSLTPDALRLVPDGQPAEAHQWEMDGARLRIWWPPHLLHEYARAK
jgi:hypothetical protein